MLHGQAQVDKWGSFSILAGVADLVGVPDAKELLDVPRLCLEELLGGRVVVLYNGDGSAD